MKNFLALLYLATSSSQAFVLQPVLKHASPSRSALQMAGVELVAEPEGGEELAPLSSSMAGCRVKKMKELEGVQCDFGIPYQFWLTAEIDGTLIKKIRTQILKEASKKANFPGFRKGQVPPYAQPQITQFSIQESIIKTVQAVVDSYGLKELPGSDGEVVVKEDVKGMTTLYKVGDSVQFTATLNGYFDPEKQQEASTPPKEGVVETEQETANA